MIAIFAPEGVMAKKRSYKGYRKLPFSTSVAPAGLAQDDVEETNLSQVMTEERRILSIDASYTQDLTTGTGPTEFGVAHSDYSAAEIEECLEAIAAWDEGDKVALEQSKRLVRRIGAFGAAAAGVFNDGRPMKTRLNWRIATGDTLSFWVRNRDGTAITGLLNAQGVAHSVLV